MQCFALAENAAVIRGKEKQSSYSMPPTHRKNKGEKKQYTRHRVEYNIHEPAHFH